MAPYSLSLANHEALVTAQERQHVMVLTKSNAVLFEESAAVLGLRSWPAVREGFAGQSQPTVGSIMLQARNVSRSVENGLEKGESDSKELLLGFDGLAPFAVDAQGGEHC